MPGLVVRIIVAGFVLAGAVMAIGFGGITEWLACDVEPSEACEREDLARLQYGVAWLGLVPALALAAALVARRRYLALGALAVCAITYAVWAVLVDAATHGWDDLKLIPFAAVVAVVA